MKLLQPLGKFFTPHHHDAPTQIDDTHAQHLVASLLTMAWFVEARDPYTGGHLWRVSRYAKYLAEAAGETPTDTAVISLGGFLHDLGKIAIPDDVLRKPGRLTDEEFDVIKTHPNQGYRMLAGHPLVPLVKDAILSHHERPDGCGYPGQLTHAEIPKAAKIIGICDAFDAMTSHRPYRAGMLKEKALQIIKGHAGSQFDEHYAIWFCQLDQNGILDEVIGHSDEGIPLRECPMCGPTLTIYRHHQETDHIYCRNCGGEFILQQNQQQLFANSTGKRGKPADLEPEIDHQLIYEIVQQSVKALPSDIVVPYLRAKN